MDRIRSLVALARLRLLLQEWMLASWFVLSIVAGVVLLIIIERRVIGASAAIGVPSRSAMWLVGSIAFACGLAALIGWLQVRARQQTMEQVALELDARIGSGERLSTALALSADETLSSDAFARAAIADAVAYAGDPDLIGRTREAFPVRLGDRWWVAPSLLVAVVGAWWFIPQRITDPAVLKDAEATLATERPKSPEEKRLEELLKTVEQTPELAAKLDAELETARRTLDEAANGPIRSPDDAARESLKRMAELQQRLAEVADSKESKASRELRDSLAKLDLPKDQNAARDLAEALKQGDFEAAKKAVEELKKAAAGSELSKEEREKLAKALENTAKQLETLSKDPAKMAEALRSAGMDPALANNAQALQQAIAQSKDLNDSQKEALQKMAQSVKDAQSQLGQMSQQMDQMASQCKNPGQQGQKGDKGQQGQKGQSGEKGEKGDQGSESQGQSGQGEKSGKDGGDMAQMLDQAESDRQMAMAADSANGQCQGGQQSSGMSEAEADSALSASAESAKSGNGNGKKQGSSGNRAEAGGGDRAFRETGFGTKLQKEKGQKQDGDVIARQLVAGQSPVGESRVGLQEVAGTIATGYERGSEDDPVPAHLRDVHKRYFGDLRKKFEERGVEAKKPAGDASGK